MDGNAGDPLQWYYEIPPVSRTYMTAAFVTTALTALDLVSPIQFFLNWKLVMQGQAWRLLTTFLFFGTLSLDFLFHMYFLARYCRQVLHCRLLEEGEFHRKTSDFVFFLLFGAVLMLAAQPLVSLPFLGSSLSFMMVYVWGRRNEHVRMSLFGLLPFTAPYLPWVLLAVSVLVNNSGALSTDLLGIGVGHMYYFLAFIYPEVSALTKQATRAHT
ncbi:Derlin [Tribonema minus]|uniref:Derlin n=1 Tax=Tribonema minus TaxID=303371 RepID=A0A836CIV7_9STRA|nr:Derlin [Tribonema minus]